MLDKKEEIKEVKKISQDEQLQQTCDFVENTIRGILLRKLKEDKGIFELIDNIIKANFINHEVKLDLDLGISLSVNKLTEPEQSN